jgi:hypothetical protein
MAVFVTFAIAQQSEFVETKQFTDKTLGGECILKNAKLSVEGQIVSKIFELDVPSSGEYYLNAWAMGINTQKGIQNLKVYVDKQDQLSGNVVMSETGWQSTKLVSSTNKAVVKRLSLDAGTHTITFQTEVPYVPAIEFIRLAKDETKAAISDLKYRSYLDEIKTSVLPVKYAQIKSSLAGNDSTGTRLFKVLPNPEGDYAHDLGVNFSYTYYTQLYFYAGAQVVLETKKADPYASDPVMWFFNSTDPINNGSWVDDDGGEGTQSKITCTVQYTGYYYVFVISYGLGTSGTSDLYLYDNLYVANIPLTHSGLRSDHTPAEVLNYFTSRLTGDSRIWIEDQNGFPGTIKGYNDDYYGGGGDFYWGLSSRVKKQFSMSIRSMQLSSYSSYNPTGTCDMYMKCGNSTIYTAQDDYGNLAFPNLKADDAIRTALQSGVYNCISWSGGITSYWEWPLNPGSRYYIIGNPLASFDHCYGNIDKYEISNPRYAGAWTYTRNGATSSNNQIDLWSLNGSYTHGSVNSRYDNIPCDTPANGHPHGYDWESKPGGLMRTFHPRNALSGNAYGSVDKYYKKPDVLGKVSSEYITSEESIRRGLSTLDKVILSESELSKMATLKKALTDKEVEEFNDKYVAWKETWSDPKVSIYSDPRKYAESEEYSEFIQYCIDKDKNILPLLLEKLEQGDVFVIVPLEDLTFTGNDKLMEAVHKENLENQLTKEGAFIIHTLQGNWMKYGKKLLANFDEYKGFIPSKGESGLGQNISIPTNEVIIKNYPNPFNPSTQIKYGIGSEGKVTISIYDILGRQIALLINNEFQVAGWHTTTWNGKDMNGNSVSSGIYFCQLLSGRQVQTTKLILMR